jgi:hypothetical protein
LIIGVVVVAVGVVDEEEIVPFDVEDDDDE